jgi:signal transduction histidine kinase
VRATADGGRLRLSVTDDGPGFDGLNPPPGHGLMLMRDRLQVLFGERARLVIDGQAGRATVAIEIDTGDPIAVRAEPAAAFTEPRLVR